jgi:gluconolactonase
LNYFSRLSVFLVTGIIFLITLSVVSAQSPIPSGAKVEQIVTGIQQPEGPVWMDGVGLLFSDIKAAKIYKWTADKGKEIYMAHSDSSNGLTLDLQGRLILTQMGKRRVSRQETDGTITPLATTYNGKKLNSPNDIVVKSDGSIFFTDPDFNIPVGGTTEILINGQYIKGVYRLKPNGDIQLLDGTFNKPNGICFSPDENKLYVNDWATGKIYVWDVVNDSTITNKRSFNTTVLSGTDGMKVDSAGNLYCACNGGVSIFSPAGVYLDKIAIPNGSTSNCAWGDADRKTLYITGGTSVYKIRMADPSGVNDGHGSIVPKTMELFQNYPNPFNPETKIEWQISKSGFVNLKIFNSLGCEVTTLVNEYKQAGKYISLFSIRNVPAGRISASLSSGVYYCRLTAGDFVQVKKMILMK